MIRIRPDADCAAAIYHLFHLVPDRIEQARKLILVKVTQESDGSKREEQ